jgi:outer membrane protein OmpA-like peptidoglycan-associated protein
MTRNTLSIALVLVILLASGCRHRPTPAPPPPSSTIILLPNDDGSSSGSLTVSNAGGTQQLTDAYSSVKVSRANTAPSAPVRVDPSEVQRLFGETLALMPAAEARFNLYFESGGTVLTAESAAELPRIIEAYRARRSTDVTIIGHTDTVGESQTNYQLGLQRAGQISQDLQAQGVKGSDIFIESHGESDLLVPTPDKVEEPRNRRVEVIVR